MRTKQREGTNLITYGAMGALLFGCALWFYFDYVTPLLFAPESQEGFLESAGLASFMALGIAAIMMGFVALLIFGAQTVYSGRTNKKINQDDVNSATTLANALVSVAMGIMAWAVVMNHFGIHDAYIAFMAFIPVASPVAFISFVAIGIYWGAVSAVVCRLDRRLIGA